MNTIKLEITQTTNDAGQLILEEFEIADIIQFQTK